MFQLLRIPLSKFKQLPRSVKTVCLLLPPAASHIFYSLLSQPKLKDSSLSECEGWFSNLPLDKEHSVLKILVTELSNSDNLLSAAIKAREKAIQEKEEKELCLLSVPEPHASSILLQGVEKASGSPFVIQKREYRAVPSARGHSNKETDSVSEEAEMSAAKKLLYDLSCVSERAIAKALKRSEELCQLVLKDPDVVAKRFQWLQSQNFSNQDIIKFGGLLTVSPRELEKRFDVVSRKFEDFSTLRITAGILGVETLSLDMYMRRWKSEAEMNRMKSRVHWFSEKLEVNCQDVIDQMDTKPMLMTYSFDGLRKKLLLLLEAGLKPKDLYDDLWTLARMEESLFERLRILKEAGVQNIKPWHLRCSVKSLDRCTSTSSATIAAKTKYPDLRVYLKKKLNIDDQCVEHIVSAAPQLTEHSNFDKTDELLNYLLKEGFTSEQIVSGPRVLTVSLETVKERVETIRDLGFGVKDVPKSYFWTDKYHFEEARERLQTLGLRPGLKPRKSRRSFIG